MRTKTLILTAALAVASILAANAQVFSVNAVGYVNKTVPKKGFALISNPLIASNNSISNLLGGQIPSGTEIYLWDTAGKKFLVDSYDPDFGGWQSLGNTNITPGQGFFIKNNSDADIKITFVGEVPQGTGGNALKTPLIPGFQIVSSQVPQTGTAADLGYTGQAGDQIYQWNVATQKYEPYQYDADFGAWSPDLKPLDVGDAFFLSKTQAGTWTRDFTVNQ